MSPAFRNFPGRFTPPWTFANDYGDLWYWWDDTAGEYKVYLPGRLSRTKDKANLSTYVPGGVLHPDAAAVQYPDGQTGVPLRAWRRASSGTLAMSTHVEQSRWIKVTAFVDAFAGPVTIPLTDSNDLPMIGPETLPMMVVRRSGYAAGQADQVTDPKSGGWLDTATGWRVNQEYGSLIAVRATLHLDRSLYDTWVLTIEVASNNITSSTFANVMVDLVGTGALAPSAASKEVGSSGNHGHYRIRNQWSTVDFLASTARSQFNERACTRGAIDVAGNTSPIYYLATPNALSTDTNPFSTGTNDVPMVRVLGSATSGSYVTHSPESNWNPTTWGLGCRAFGGTALQNRAYQYQTSVAWDAGNSLWAVTIDNATFDAGAAQNRTFFVYALGKRA